MATAALHLLNRVNALVVPLRIVQCLPLTVRGPPSTGRSPLLTACAPSLRKLSACCSGRCVASEAFNTTVDPHRRQNRTTTRCLVSATHHRPSIRIQRAYHRAKTRNWSIRSIFPRSSCFQQRRRFAEQSCRLNRR
jgi:hypothetical protein